MTYKRGNPKAPIVSLEPRICSDCGSSSPEAVFTYHFNRSTECRKCQQKNYTVTEELLEYRRARESRWPKSMWKRIRDNFKSSRENKCSICGAEETALLSKSSGTIKGLAVDHCRTREVFRGLLCQKCNVGLGFFKENPLLLEAAAQYLETHHGV